MIFETEQHLDELTGADHLRNHVESDDDQRTAGGENAGWRLREAISRHVGKGEFPEVTQAFSHQKGDDRPTDQPADRED